MLFPRMSVEKVEAYTIRQVNVLNQNDFVLEPAKIDVRGNPGETITKNISVTSRLQGTERFRLDTEDFTGSKNEAEAVVLLPDERSPFSFQENLEPEIRTFTLDFGEQIAIPIKIKIPANASPGGYYASVLVSNVSENSTTNGSAKIVSRVGALFFVRVNGSAKEEGSLNDFRIKGSKSLIYGEGPLTFQILFENKGNIHLTPYGKIRIKNSIGKVVSELPVEAYFALPQAMRYRDILWNGRGLFGRYTASLELYRGYGGKIDQDIISFWIVPKTVFVYGFVLLAVLILGLIFLPKFKRKQKL